MNRSTVALLTDFGTADPYVGIVKGVILSRTRATIVDLSHEVRPHDPAHAAFLLRQAIPYFPKRTIFVCVVDPGVGGGREIVCVAAGAHLFLAPDNGLLSFLKPRSIHAVTRTALKPVSATFHGRDIFAPAAAHLARGGAPSALGPRRTRLKSLPHRPGAVVSIDRFGNVITDVTGRPREVRIGRRRIRRFVRTYAEAPRGELVALVGSAGTLEIALREGRAQDRLRARIGDRVRVT